jgi:cell division septation protein DedD
MKRMHTRARGGGARINKRSAHIKITLTEAEPVEKPVKAKAIKKDKAKLSPKTSDKPAASKKAEKAADESSAAPALVAPEPDPSQLRAEAADKTSKSLAAGEHPEKVTAAD